MKRIIICLLAAAIMVLCAACEQKNLNSENTVSDTNIDGVEETENGGNDNTNETVQMPQEFDGNKDNEGSAGGTTTLCTIHAHNTHAFTHSLIEYVGEEAFNQWVSGASMQPIDEGCRNPEYTIYGFIKHFNVPKHVFEEIYYTKCYNTYYYDVDLFYSDDEAGIQEFFLDKDTAEDVICKRVALDELKHGVYSKNYNLFVQKFGDISYEAVTLVDMVRELNVPRELLEDYASKTTTGRSYDYNFDLLYLDQGNNLQLSTEEFAEFERFNNMMLEASKDSYPVRAADAIICGVDDYRTE